MNLPAPLRQAIDRALERTPLPALRQAASTLSERYRGEVRDGRLHMADDLAVKAYLAQRMPATYAAIRASLGALAEARPDFRPKTLLDIGAGPGTALWAVADLWPGLEQAVLIEASDAARATGRALAQDSLNIRTDWVKGDATRGLPTSKPADLVTMAYVLDELAPSEVAPLIDRIWAVAADAVLIVEPGTPAGWRRILAARMQLIKYGAQVVAPCPHDLPCRLEGSDWCHFSRRVARSRLHRLTKDADVPWEDEKFAYLAVSRHSRDATRNPRVLAPPRAGSGKVSLKLCQPDGRAAEQLFTKRNGEGYKIARRAGWGDSLQLDADLCS
ncbi:MAG: methyltransferase type 11 [Proteobacteria bacterium]|nr:MAG: methyltransferase type 11 [Pseudomonadota bacterium]